MQNVLSRYRVPPSRYALPVALLLVHRRRRIAAVRPRQLRHSCGKEWDVPRLRYWIFLAKSLYANERDAFRQKHHAQDLIEGACQ